MKMPQDIETNPRSLSRPAGQAGPSALSNGILEINSTGLFLSSPPNKQQTSSRIVIPRDGLLILVVICFGVIAWVDASCCHSVSLLVLQRSICATRSLNHSHFQWLSERTQRKSSSVWSTRVPYASFMLLMILQMVLYPTYSTYTYSIGIFVIKALKFGV